MPPPPLQEEGTSREMRQGSMTVRFETPQEARFTRARRAGLLARAPYCLGNEGPRLLFGGQRERRLCTIIWERPQGAHL